jgi:hypothetical protein
MIEPLYYEVILKLIALLFYVLNLLICDYLKAHNCQNFNTHIVLNTKKAVSLHAMKANGGRRGIAPTHS